MDRTIHLEDDGGGNNVKGFNQLFV